MSIVRAHANDDELESIYELKRSGLSTKKLCINCYW